MNFSIRLLNGEWNFVTGVDDKLTYEQLVKVIKKKKTKKINIPVNWELAALHNFSGSIWFIKSFRVNNSSALKILEFEGVDYFADVWLNDIYIGHHEGYFQKFYFDVTKRILNREENLLVAKVNSPKEEPGKVWPYKKKLIKGIFNHHDCRPGGWSLEHGQDQNTGGIWKDVKLNSLKNVYVENIRVTPEFKNKNVALINVVIDYYTNTSLLEPEALDCEILTPAKKKILEKVKITFRKGKQTISFSVEIKNPELWWSWDLGEPNLYLLKLRSSQFYFLGVKFGIRKVEFNDKKEFYLNGKRLFLRGTNIIPTQFLSDLDSKKINKQIRLVKEANINIIRVHAHINRKEFYDECDKQGILVWQDFPLQWTYDSSKTFAKNASSQIKDMVKQNYNHPSIAFWCCHNEPGEQIKTLDPLLKRSVLSIDKSRVVRLASNYEEHPYDGWYWGKKEHFTARPMGPLVTEFGAQAIPEINSLKKFIPEKQLDPPDWEKWEYHNFQYDQTFNIACVERGESLKEFINNSQSYQAKLIKTAVDYYRQGKWKDITGIFQFMFIDCWSSITWSVIDYYWKKKKGYYALQQAFQPVYVSINVLQEKYMRGKQLNLEIWVINDLYKSFRNCSIIFRIKNEILGSIKTSDIKTDSILHFKRENTNIKLPQSMKVGSYNVSVELKSKHEVISTNNFEIEVVKKK